MSSPDHAVPGGTPVLEPGRCHGCCRWTSTRPVTYRQSIGALILRFPSGVRGEFCARCRQRYFWTFTGVTLVLGWWGIISFFYTLFVLPANVFWHLRAAGSGRDDTGPVSTGACHWCGGAGLGRADVPGSLIVAAVLGAFIGFSGVIGSVRALVGADPSRVLFPLVTVVALIPAVVLVLRLRRPFDHCTRCGNDQPAA